MKEEKTRKTVIHISPLVGQKLQIKKVQYITDIFGTFSIEKNLSYIQNDRQWYKRLKITISIQCLVLRQLRKTGYNSMCLH